MSKLDLKTAMDSLQVKKPLKLFNKLPQFKAPTLVPEAIWGAEKTQVATPTQVIPETMVPVEAQVATNTPVDLPTQAPVNTMVHEDTQVASTTLVAPATEVDVTEQDSSVTLESQSIPKLNLGYTRLPNSFLMKMASGELLRSEIQILLLIARFTISFQKRFAPLSKAVLERQSGLRGPAVLQAIATLIEKGFIEKIPGDQHRPNQLGLVFEDEWELFSKNKAANTLVSPATPVASATTPLVAGTTPAEVPAATYFKDTQTIKNKDSLSGLPVELQNYFESLKPARKRESEWRVFLELKGNYSVDEIAMSLEHILEFGLLGTGETCHSPMAYLGKAIDAVLKKAQTDHEKEKRVQERNRASKDLETQAQSQTVASKHESHTREAAFVEAFPNPSDQAAYIQDHVHGFPMLDPQGLVVRKLIIGEWYASCKLTTLENS